MENQQWMPRVAESPFRNPSPERKGFDTRDPESERLFFPTNRPLHKKDLILRSLLKPETIEDHSRIISHRFPVSWEDLGIKDLGTG
jgi:hypothetical protein